MSREEALDTAVNSAMDKFELLLSHLEYPFTESDIRAAFRIAKEIHKVLQEVAEPEE